MYRLISVIGGNTASEEESSFAFMLGGLLADAGLSIVCGGGSGVMEAVCRGCFEAGGLTVGILPGEEGSQANPFVSLSLPTGMGVSRNRMIALAGEAVCAVGGAYGTLSEIAFALQSGKPVCCFGSWESIPGVKRVATPMEAVEFVLEVIGDN
ncbi:MAG: TIGR00725 family protein [Candidatus Sabulitectum sp.]|nr:TIGR00725 family protein [Candidatus Sabulitectum sp.]